MLQTKLLSSLAKVFPDEIQGREYTTATALNNEPFSFQVAYRAVRMNGGGVPLLLKIESDLDLELISCYKVGFVPVVHGTTNRPDDHYSRTTPGLYPDPLFKRNTVNRFEIRDPWASRRFEVDEKNQLMALPESYQSLWLTVNEDSKTIPGGTHTITLIFYNGADEAEIGRTTFTLEVIDAALHAQDLNYTSWFHYDCLADTYGVEIFSDKYFEIMKSFVTAAAKTGMTMLLLPAFTPPLDTPVGKERKTAQLVGVEVKGGEYTFDFSLMKRFIEICRECGMYHFEHSHLFSQWGAQHAPKIMATVDGEYKRIFGWDTDSKGEEYSKFLTAYLKELMVFFKEMNIGKEDVLFHISDEPQESHLEYYGNALNVIKAQIEGYHTGDALAHFKFYENGYVETPIPVNDSPEMDLFVKNCENFWVYYTGGQAHDGFSGRLISTTSARCRMLGIQMYVAGAKGFLHWGYNYYYDVMSHGLFNPLADPCGYTQSPGTCFMVYPAADGTAIMSLRMKVLNEGFIDYRALQTLEGYIGREAVLAFLQENFGTIAFDTCYNEVDLLDARNKINAKIAECM